MLDLVEVPQDEIDKKLYGPGTDRAVLAFKKKLDIRRPGQQEADPITGKSTLAHLDDELARLEGKAPKPSEGPADSPDEFVDVVVRFVGAFMADGDSYVLGALGIGPYLSKNKGKRTLLPMGIGAHADKAVHFGPIVRRIEAAVRAPGRRGGVICILGNSLGGRHAINLALALLRNGLHTDYLGVADAAFHPEDKTTDPVVLVVPTPVGPFAIGKPLKAPVFRVRPIGAGTQANYYQTHGNSAKTAARELPRTAWVWCSGMFGDEIHGRIEGGLSKTSPWTTRSACSPRTRIDTTRTAAGSGRRPTCGTSAVFSTACSRRRARRVAPRRRGAC